ncbi:MAG: 1-(5-phosphoribosyl)-5-[(5-phosphoribosylamino)methylideneamino]imidazole-4-carboxamide isomerase [Chloroflexi bacterium]|nr:1-(5-phosphoribosyl)-5-[(5-phosphoribosylamino)methylideneamino]imidazole-4-carboxamide isomerase [Chloroflexota bacterium]
MEVYPPVDIRGGRCVQLVQGDFNRETVFYDDPVEAARHWMAQGAAWLHVVDLNGARDGVSTNAAIIEDIIKVAGDVPVQVAGGLRSPADIERVLGHGAARIVLGTAAVRDPEMLARAAAAHPGRIAVAVEGRQGMAVTDAWAKESTLTVAELAARAVDAGAAAIMYTDVVVEGMLEGPNVAGTRDLVEQVGAHLPVVASGGVASLDDIARLRDAGASGVIIGSALYRGAFTLAEAIQAAAGEARC